MKQTEAKKDDLRAYKVIIDGEMVGVHAPTGKHALKAAIDGINGLDLERRLDSPPADKSRRVTISVVKMVNL